MQQRGEITGSSFGFIVTNEEVRREGNLVIREITDVELFDVGPVTYPAYQATSQRNRRCVTATGHCDVMPAEVAAEIRSAISTQVGNSDDVRKLLQRLGQSS